MDKLAIDFVRPFPGKKPGEPLTKQEIISAVRLALCAEEEATHLYDTIAEYVDDPDVKALMTDVATEEQVHKGEFQELLDRLESDEEEKVEEGKQEAQDKMKTAACVTPGKKIRSKGKGRGLGRGKGEGPVGIPVGEKRAGAFLKGLLDGLGI